AAHGFFEKLVAGDSQTENHPQHHGQSVAEQHALHANHDRNPEAVIGKPGPQRLRHTLRCGEHVGGPNSQFGQQHPNPNEHAIEDGMPGEALHAETSFGPYCSSSDLLISSRKSSRISRALLATVISSSTRGRGRSMINSRFTRPGRKVIRATRSPSRTASRTLWVTKIMVRPVSAQMRS